MSVLPQNPSIRGDPLSSLIVGRLRIKPWLATLGICLAVNIPIVSVALLKGFWFNTGDNIGLANDYGWWIFQLTSIPATVFTFFWMPSGILATLDGLKRSRVIIIPDAQGESNDNLSEFVSKLDRHYSHWAWPTLSLTSALAFVIVMVPVHRTFKGWANLNEFAFWYAEAIWFLLAVFVCLIAIRWVIAVVWFNRLFREFRIDVRVLHPDGAGGLSPLSSLSVKVGYLIGIYGLAIAAATLTQSYLLTGQFGSLVLNPPLVIIILIYMALTPIAFFAPIGVAHSSMRTAKEEFILRIADQFEADFSVTQSLLSADSDKLAKNLEKIEQLQQLHRLSSQFPVWPFNTENVIRFFSSTIAPVALALLPTIISALLP